MRAPKSLAIVARLMLFVCAAFVVSWSAAQGAPGDPIRHIVVIYQENHSFDNVLGRLCAADHRCNGATTGVLPDGSIIPLAKAPDLVPNVGHAEGAQRVAIDGGAMNGFADIFGCNAASQYGCYSQYSPHQIPNLATLARSFALSDATFESTPLSSWGSHLQLASSDTDGFIGSPKRGTSSHHGQGGGCDSFKDAPWVSSPTASPIMVPACIPDKTGFGPYRTSPVPYIPTIMDRLDTAGLSWKLYAADGPGEGGGGTGYVWAICPTYAECLYSNQVKHFVPSSTVIPAATNGKLPNVSFVIPNGAHSQHNHQSMTMGDNWIGSVVSAIENGPDWDSTAIFITYDDCGCFYDHIAPPSGAGIRAPMVIVSPYAKAGYTDSTRTTFNGMLAFIESTFGLQPLSAADANAYDFSKSFDYTQTPLPPVRMVQRPVNQAELRWIKAHPENDIT